MKRDEIKAGVLLSYLNLLIGNLIPFIYTPIMLRILGQAEYGIYGIAQSVMGYIGLLNFGIGGSIIRYLSKYRAEGDLDGERRVFGLFIKIYSVIGAAVFDCRYILLVPSGGIRPIPDAGRAGASGAAGAVDDTEYGGFHAVQCV